MPDSMGQLPISSSAAWESAVPKRAARNGTPNLVGHSCYGETATLPCESETEDPLSDSLEDRFQRLEQDERIESMLSQLKLLI